MRLIYSIVFTVDWFKSFVFSTRQWKSKISYTRTCTHILLDHVEMQPFHQTPIRTFCSRFLCLCAHYQVTRVQIRIIQLFELMKWAETRNHRTGRWLAVSERNTSTPLLRRDQVQLELQFYSVKWQIVCNSTFKTSNLICFWLHTNRSDGFLLVAIIYSNHCCVRFCAVLFNTGNQFNWL